MIDSRSVDRVVLGVDLPSLNSLILGNSALQGRYDANCSLTMQSTEFHELTN